MVRHLFQSIGYQGDVRDILKGRATTLSCIDIEHLHTATIRGDIDMITIQGQVLGRISSCQRIDWRSRLQCLFHNVSWNFNYRCIPIYIGPMGFPDIQCAVGAESDPYRFYNG